MHVGQRLQSIFIDEDVKCDTTLPELNETYT
jgi:hypothetical protein